MIRWLSFLACTGLTVWMLHSLSTSNPDLFTKAGFKLEVTRLAVAMDLAPLWAFPAFLAGAVSAMIFGVPSIVVFALLLISKGFPIALITTWAAQMAATIFSIWLAGKFARPGKIQPQLLTRLRNAQDHYQSFAFWSRVYYSFPLRTIDSISPTIQPENTSTASTILAAAPAILLRLLLPSLWLDSLHSLVTSISPDPAVDATWFLLWSSALVAYTMIPRVPELFICPEKIKKVLVQIESPFTPADPVPAAPAAQVQQPSKKPFAGSAPAVKTGAGSQPGYVK